MLTTLHGGLQPNDYTIAWGEGSLDPLIARKEINTAKKGRNLRWTIIHWSRKSGNVEAKESKLLKLSQKKIDMKMM